MKLGEWISVEDMRPEPEVLVLCWDGQKTYVEWFGSIHPRDRGVTHWMAYKAPPGALCDMHDGFRAFERGGSMRDVTPASIAEGLGNVAHSPVARRDGK